MPSLASAIDLSLAAFGLYLLKRILAPKPPAPYPPGPKPLPVLGNLLQYPQQKEWETFTQWSHDFGDLVMVNLLGQRMLILNSAKVATELLDKKSSVYSERPKMVMAGNLVGWNDALALCDSGDRFRELRRLMHGAIAGRANVADLAAVSQQETHRFLLRVMKQPAMLQEQVRKLAGAVIIKVTYGYDVNEGKDPIVDLIDKTMDDFSKITAPGAYLVDMMPFLAYLPSWFPGAGFLKQAEEMKKTLYDAMDVPHAYVKQQMAAGNEKPSYTAKNLDGKEVDAHQESLIKWGALAIYGGGADTTVSAEYSFYLAMALHPEAQKLAQAEIDRVVGSDRLPTLADREHLPYTEALMKEVLRWNPVAPQGLPHRVKEDDIHDGYFIPKDTLVIANIWKFLHDPRTYENPMSFNPARFLSTPAKPAEEDPRHFCFGFGRRICPGKDLAENSIFLAVAMSLAAFDIRKPVDPTTGAVVEPVVDYSSGIISHPKAFPCDIKPRSDRHRALVLAAEDLQ